MILRTSLNHLLKKQFNVVTRRNIVSKIRRPDGLLRPLQRPDIPIEFEKSMQLGDIFWLTMWTICAVEGSYLAYKLFKRYTSPHKYIRMKHPSWPTT